MRGLVFLSAFSLAAPSSVWSCGFRFKFRREAKREKEKGKKLQRSRKKRGGDRRNQSGKMVVNSCMQKNWLNGCRWSSNRRSSTYYVGAKLMLAIQPSRTHVEALVKANTIIHTWSHQIGVSCALRLRSRPPHILGEAVIEAIPVRTSSQTILIHWINGLFT